jgi:hypothetical protein
MYLTQDFQDGDWKAKATLKLDEEIGVILKELSKAAPCKEKEEDLLVSRWIHSNIPTRRVRVAAFGVLIHIVRIENSTGWSMSTSS